MRVLPKSKIYIARLAELHVDRPLKLLARIATVLARGAGLDVLHEVAHLRRSTSTRTILNPAVPVIFCPLVANGARSPKRATIALPAYSRKGPVEGRSRIRLRRLTRECAKTTIDGLARIATRLVIDHRRTSS